MTFLILKVHLICIFPCRSLGLILLVGLICCGLALSLHFSYHPHVSHSSALLESFNYMILHYAFSHLPIQSSNNESRTCLWPSSSSSLIDHVFLFSV
jgi:hypothetical protein